MLNTSRRGGEAFRSGTEYLEAPEDEERPTGPRTASASAGWTRPTIGASVLVVLGLWKVEELIVGVIWKGGPVARLSRARSGLTRDEVLAFSHRIRAFLVRKPIPPEQPCRGQLSNLAFHCGMGRRSP